MSTSEPPVLTLRPGPFTPSFPFGPFDEPGRLETCAEPGFAMSVDFDPKETGVPGRDWATPP